MRQLHRKGLATVMLTGGALALTGHAYADAGADGAAAGSPGVLAGNTVQLPVHVPVNVCGNTINVVGLLNPAAGNSCENTSQDDGRRAGHGSKEPPQRVAERIPRASCPATASSFRSMCRSTSRGTQ